MKIKHCQKILMISLLLSVNAFAEAERGTATDTVSDQIVVLPVRSNVVNPWVNAAPPIDINDLGRNLDYGNIVNPRPFKFGEVNLPPGFGDPAINLSGFGNIKNRSARNFSDPYDPNNYASYDPNNLTNFLNTRQGDLQFMIRPQDIPTLDLNSSVDSQAFNADDIFCTVEAPSIPADLSSLGEEFDIQSCFDMRAGIDARGRDRDLIQTDIRSCECLERKTLSRDIMKQSLASNNLFSTEARNLVTGQIQNYVQNELSSTMNGIFFTSAVVFNEKLDANAQAYPFSANVFTNSTVNIEGQRSLDLRYAPDYSKMFEDEYPLPVGQCLSKQEYFRMRMIPEGRDLALIRGELSQEYQAEHWNYESLTAEYRELMNKPTRERAGDRVRIIKLKAKLKFLNRNPLIKYYMASNEGDSGTKSQIFNQLKQSFNDEGCQEITSACTENFHRSLENLLKNDNARTVIRNEARNDLNNKIRTEASRDFYSSQQDFRRGRGRRPDREAMIRSFRENFGLASTPDDCHSSRNSSLDENSALSCIQMFSAYCKTVDEFDRQLKDAESSERGIPREVLADIEDNLDKDTRDDFNPILQDNADFDRLNDIHCGERSAGAGLLRSLVDFQKFQTNKCRDGDTTACRISSHADLVRLRKEFYDSLPVGRGDSIGRPAESLSNGSMVREVGSQRYFTNERPTWESFRGSDNLVSQPSQSEDSPSYSTLSGTQTTQISNVRSDSEQDSFNYTNYNNLLPGNSIIPGSQTGAEAPKIQDMDQERRQELLNDWEREYNAWKENKGTNLSSADQTRDSELRTEITTLRALLEQQRSISDQQYKLLNDAIAAKTQLERDNIERSDARRREDSTERTAGVSGTSRSNGTFDTDGRSPASIPEPMASPGAGAGVTSTTGSASLGGGSSFRSSAAGPNGSSDSVAREEAKLVNLRSNSDGSIVIVPSGIGSNTAPNAITLSVSDEQYRILQTNPRGLNLSQIERSIPREQIAQLERNGEIILLLSNGQNPPYEVKVKKKDNKLVYSVVDQNGREQAPVRRVFTRNALINNLTQ